MYGEGSGTILMDEVNCNGHEQNIDDCLYTSSNDVDCIHSEDAGVKCYFEQETIPGNYIP